MRVIAAIIGLSLFGTHVQASLAQNSTETIRFAIMRDGTKIGTHDIAINRTGPETSVTLTTDLKVKVLFVTAYRLEQTTSERWVNGLLVGLSSETDNNGTRHKVAVTPKPPGLEIEADGTTSRVDKNIVPGTLWNPAFLKRSVMLDAQDGKVFPFTVVNGGPEELTLKGQPVKANRYTIKGRYTQDVWYDEKGKLVRAQLIATDGSIILYELI